MVEIIYPRQNSHCFVFDVSMYAFVILVRQLYFEKYQYLTWLESEWWLLKRNINGHINWAGVEIKPFLNLVLTVNFWTGMASFQACHLEEGLFFQGFDLKCKEMGKKLAE